MRWMLAITMVFLAGCRISRRGDVTVTTSIPLLGYKGDRDYSVEFPSFAIDRCGEFHWKVRDLPLASFDYDLELPLPFMGYEAGNRAVEAGKEPAWRDLTISVSVYSPEGILIGQQTCRPGDSLATTGWPDDTIFKFSLRALPLQRLQNYNLLISVIDPQHGSISPRESGDGLRMFCQSMVVADACGHLPT